MELNNSWVFYHSHYGNFCLVLSQIHRLVENDIKTNSDTKILSVTFLSSVVSPCAAFHFVGKLMHDEKWGATNHNFTDFLITVTVSLSFLHLLFVYDFDCIFESWFNVSRSANRRKRSLPKNLAKLIVSHMLFEYCILLYLLHDGVGGAWCCKIGVPPHDSRRMKQQRSALFNRLVF